MGSRNPTRRELLEYAFPVRLKIEHAGSSAYDPVARSLARVLGRQAHGRLGGLVYLQSLAQATGFVCACPEIRFGSDWPVRLTVAFEQTQEMLVRDALRPIVGDAGYVLARAGHHRADRPAWHLGLRCVWDGVQFARMPHPGIIVMERWIGRNG